MAMLGGVSEVAERIGVSRQRFGELRAREDFPEPVAELATGPVWDLEDVDRWMSSGARRGPGRPSTSERVVGGRFILEEPALGAGGFAEVFRATDRKTGDVVAVKVLKDVHNIDDEAVVRFRRELRLMEESLDHPHVAKILAHGDFSDTDQIWCAMPLAVGSLQDEISSMKDDVAVVVDLARQLCAGVGHVHAQGILHRDLKPGNILRSADGTWTVSDFGLAREDERKSLALTTTLAQGMGTYIYASPEQWTRPKYADKRDDIYSIGKILQHAITGDFPLTSADQIPDSPLRPVIQRATGPRDNRYADTSALMLAIDQAMSAYSSTWEAPEDKLARLLPRLAAPSVDPLAAEELIQWLLSDNIKDEINDAAKALIGASRAAIEFLWRNNPTAFRTAYHRVAEWMRIYGFPFEYCDNIANSARMIVSVTGDNDVLRHSVAGLAVLGRDHNRWHVRDVLVEILQGLRDHEKAVVALEGLQSVPAHVVDWSVTDFGMRTMHPVLRQGIGEIKDGLQSAS